jgi:F0F1-type ATP synthase epsilon subunit
MMYGRQKEQSMPIHLEIVTAERVILSDDVDMISAPTKMGALVFCHVTLR